MQIWPAIDIRAGKCVRLQQGDYTQETVFGDDPTAMAVRWVEEGAQWLHLVDLDGARDGRAVNRDVIESILRQVNVPCELGGGVRDEATITAWLDAGLQRVVVGTQAIKDPDWFRKMCGKYPGQLALGIDARDGQVAVEGWLETSNVNAADLARRYAGESIAAIVYTDIAKDGMMSGPNLPAMDQMKQSVDIPVIASGGVTTAEDVRQLVKLGLDGCIIGRSLYEGSLQLSDALASAVDR